MSQAEKPGFWEQLASQADPSNYRPARVTDVEVARLSSEEGAYYVLKQPQHRTYLRLSPQDYALWWQMDGRHSLKDLLFYSLRRFKNLPFGRLNGLVGDLRQGYFLQDAPTQVYDQIRAELARRQPENRGRALINAFLHSEWSIGGLDPFFTRLYQATSWLFHPLFQMMLWLWIVLGFGMYARLFTQATSPYALSGGGGLGLGVISLLLANLIVIFIHELAHGLTTKYLGRECDRGGFLLYWGLPAFFVDTRDTWLASARGRIAVSWAGPHSGLVIGATIGVFLTVIQLLWPAAAGSLWTNFLYQMGFFGYFSVFINLNPLLELDGYFILMDWLDMPGLRPRAFHFIRHELWGKLRANPTPRAFLYSLNRRERIFTFFGLAALIYSSYALIFAIYFWQTRLSPLVLSLWLDYGLIGRLLVLVVAAATVIPGCYYLFLLAWSQLRQWLEWLARQELLGRVEVLALLVGVPLVLVSVAAFLSGFPVFRIITWLVHVGAVVAMVQVARQWPGSRFQWVIWSLAAGMAGLTLAQLAPDNTLWWSVWLVVAAGCGAAAGLIASRTVRPAQWHNADRLGWVLVLLLGTATGFLLPRLNAALPTAIWAVSALIQVATLVSLMAFVPLFVNFARSRFWLPWGLYALALLTLPWLYHFPLLDFALALLWLYATLLYLLLGLLTEFERKTLVVADSLSERERLVNGFNHFLQGMFDVYEPIFGGRRLAEIQTQIIALQHNRQLEDERDLFALADFCRTALLLAVDRLDDLAGTPFTARVGQAAYDSLPWLEAETLVRHVLSQVGWGQKLTRTFKTTHDSRADLLRQAEIFAGFDSDGIEALLQVVEVERVRPRTPLAEQNDDATQFYLIEAGEVGVYREGEQVGLLTAGGYFGEKALLDSGRYSATYRALSDVTALVIARDRFDPLLRADTTLASQVSAGAETRQMLRRMPLFRTLSPQELMMVDRRLRPQTIPTAKLIVRQGQHRSDLFIIQAGTVEVVRRGPDGAQVVQKLGPGEHFGEYALFADTPYEATYRAATEVTLLRLDEPTFDSLVARSAELSHYVEQIGSGRLLDTRRRLGLTGLVS